MRPFERLLQVRIEDDVVTVLFETFRYNETAREIRLTARGKRMTRYVRGQQIADSVTIWEDDYEGEVIRKFGKVYEGNSWNEQVAFERDCYRPGTGQVPLDSYSRVVEGYTTDAMERYW